MLLLTTANALHSGDERGLKEANLMTSDLAELAGFAESYCAFQNVLHHFGIRSKLVTP